MKIKQLLTATFLLGATQLLAQGTLDSGLVRSYSFDGNANDATANADHGTVTGASLTADRFNQTNSAYAFNGTSDHIDFNPSGWNYSEFSFSIWANIQYDSSKNNGVGIYGLMYVGNQAINDHGITTGGNADEWTVGTYHTQGGLSNVLSGVTPTASAWHHLVFTRDADSAILYVDGVRAASTFMNGKTPGWQGTLLGVIGARPSYSFYFKGALDDIRIYNRAINATEVASLFNQTATSTIEVIQTELTLYPNPANSGSILNIETSTPMSSNAKVTLYSATGQLISKATFTRQIELPVLSHGVYYVMIEDEGTILTKKLLITN